MSVAPPPTSFEEQPVLFSGEARVSTGLKPARPPAWGSEE